VSIRTFALIAVCLILLSCNKKPAPKTETSIPTNNTEVVPIPDIGKQNQMVQPETIPYTVLRNRSGGAVIGMDILVSETTKKDEVLALARKLRMENLSSGFIMISIFDSKEACTRRLDESYPAKELFKHYLVQITVNPKTGYDNINWMADNRAH